MELGPRPRLGQRVWAEAEAEAEAEGVGLEAAPRAECRGAVSLLVQMTLVSDHRATTAAAAALAAGGAAGGVPPGHASPLWVCRRAGAFVLARLG